MIKIEKLSNSWNVTTDKKNYMIKCKSKGLIQSLYNFKNEPNIDDFVEVVKDGNREQYVEVNR